MVRESPQTKMFGALQEKANWGSRLQALFVAVL